jgi:hypothetical protein
MMRTACTMTIAAALMLASTLGAFSQQPDPGPVTARGEWTADARHWWSSDDGPRLQLNLRTDNDSNWGFGVRTSDLQGLPAAAQSGAATDVRFTMSREAGVFRF